MGRGTVWLQVPSGRQLDVVVVATHRGGNRGWGHSSGARGDEDVLVKLQELAGCVCGQVQVDVEQLLHCHVCVQQRERGECDIGLGDNIRLGGAAVARKKVQALVGRRDCTWG